MGRPRKDLTKTNLKKSEITKEPPVQMLGFSVSSPDKFKPAVIQEKANDLYKLAKTYKCCACGEGSNDQAKTFPKSYSAVYSGINYYLPICKRCIDVLFELMNAQLMDQDLAFRRVCMMFDVYYSPELVKDTIAVAPPNQRMSTYMRQSTRKIFANKTYGDTLYEEAQERDSVRLENEVLKQQNYTLTETNTQLTDLLDTREKELEEARKVQAVVTLEGGDENVSAEMLEFWGSGFTIEDYKFLQRKYDTWIATHECKTHSQEVIFQQISMLEWRIWMANTQGSSDKIEALTKQLNDYLRTADVCPKKEQDNVLADTQSFGTLIEKYEKTRPIPESEPSGLAKYICIWFFGHLCNLIGVKNPWSEMYEEEIAKYTVTPPQFEDEDNDNSASFEEVFGDAQ